MQDTVHKEGGRALNVALGPTVDILLHSLPILVVMHFVVETPELQSRHGGVLPEAFCFQMALVFEQQVVHLPEPVLPTSRFRRLGRLLRVEVHLTQRKLPEHKTHAIPESIKQYLYRVIGLAARSTFEISVLDDSDPGVLGAAHVVA